jgi:hypothetical protein
MEKYHHLIQYIPFIGLAAGEASRSPLITRIIEMAIAGMIFMFGTVKVLESDLNFIKDRIAAIEAEQKQVRRDLYMPRLQ